MNSIFFEGAAALVQHPTAPERGWMVLKSPGDLFPGVRKAAPGELRLLVAARLEQESCREALDREFSWQLNLRRRKDYLVSSMARLNYTGRLGEAPVLDLNLQFTLIKPYGREAAKLLADHPDVAWMPRTELLSHSAESGRLSSLHAQLLRQADVLQPGDETPH